MPDHSVLRYYYYLDDETAKIKDLLATLQNRLSLNPYDPHNYTEEFTPGLYYELETASVKILIIALQHNDSNWQTGISLLASCEEKAAISSDDLLGTASVLCGYGAEWEMLLEEAAGSIAVKELITAEIDHGRIARVFSSQVRGKTFYVCSLDEYTALNQRFLLEGLPQLQARMIGLQTIISLLRDRHQTIIREKDELNQKLSQILHAHLVTEQSHLEESLELENQIDELSVAYGMIAGDYALLSEDCKKINSLLNEISHQVRVQPGLKMDADIYNRLIQPYKTRLEEMLASLEELRVSRENHQAAIEVVRSKIDILNSRANIATQEQIKELMEVNTKIQKQSLIFQYAAGLIEFIVLAYYSHSLWSHLAHNAYATVPGWIQFLAVMIFSGNTVYCTHLMAEYLQGETHVRKKLWITGISLVLIFAAIVIATALTGAQSPAH
jgi:hypothetical protein